jgi:Na+/H+ antiporter NhaD/arsenite permease-like protein
MMINVHVLSLTGFFQWASVRVAATARGNVTVIFVVLAALSGVLSAFLDNVTCVMLMGPVTISLCHQMGVPSVPFYLTQALTATIGGTATMVGDPPNVVIGNKLDVPFNNFIIYNGPLVFFFLLPISIAFMLWRFRDQVPHRIQLDFETLKAQNQITDMRTFTFTTVVFGLLFLAFFLTPVHGNEPAVYTLLGMLAICLAVSRHNIRHLLEAVEWDTLVFFAALFIFVEVIAELGLIAFIGNGLTSIIKSVPIGQRPAVACLLFLWVSGLGSAFLESLPYTTTITAILLQLDEEELGFKPDRLAWALSVGACVGGIGSIMGSSANLVAVAVSVRYAQDKVLPPSPLAYSHLPTHICRFRRPPRVHDFCLVSAHALPHRATSSMANTSSSTASRC